MNNSELNPDNHDLQEESTSLSDLIQNEINESELSEETTQDSDQEILDSEINEIIQPEVDQEVIFPIYTLHRNENREKEDLKYQPGDLITLILKNTGASKSTTVEMFDSRDQSRYMGRSGGNDHEWTTRIQRTTILGNWRFTAQGPFIDENNLFSLDIPFEIVAYIPEEIPIVEEVPVIDPGYDELIQFAISEKINIPVIEIKGVGPSFQHRMNGAEVFYFHEILQSDPEILSEQLSINQIKIEMWSAFVAKVLQNKTHQLVIKYSPLVSGTGKGNELPSTIKGVGPVAENKLLAAGFNNVQSIADSNTDSLVSAIHITVNKAQTWITNANKLLSISTDPKEIASPSKIEFKLTDPPEKIIGVGPSTSKKLMASGLKTIEEIANAEITELIEALNSEKRAIKIQEGAKLILSNL